VNKSQDTHKELRLLLAGNTGHDGDWILEQLRKAGRICVSRTVTSQSDFLLGVKEFTPDLILCKYELAGCTTKETLELAQREAPNIPLVLIFRSSEKEPGITDYLKLGAADCISDEQKTGLFQAVLRAAREGEQRSELRRLEDLLKSQHELLTARNEALRVSEERFRQLAENIHEVFWMTDPEKHHMIYISPGYEKIWARTRESLHASPMSWAQAIHPDDVQRVVEALPAQKEGRYDEVYRILRPDGSIRWIHDRAFPIRNQEGRIYRVAGIAEDITERKIAEQRLAAAEADFRGIFENAVEGIFQTTPEGRFLRANPALARILGYSSAEELIETITDIGEQVCADPARRREFKQKLETEGWVREFETEIFRKDGTRIWVATNARVVRGPRPGLLHFEGTVQDITARKEAEHKVAMLAHAVESSSEMICITDLQDRFIFVNGAFEKAYGYRAAEILGKKPAILYSPKNPPEMMKEIPEGTRSGGWRGEVLDQRKDGTEFPIFLSTSEIRDSSGEVIGLMGVAQDITERRRTEQQIRLLADAVQSVNELISITDEKNRFTFVNRAFLEAYGYSNEEVIGRTPEFLYSKNNPEGLYEQVFRQTMLGRWSGEILNCRKDGTEFPISLSTSLIKDSRGNLLGLVGVGRDISERKRSEKQTAAFSWLGYRLSAATSPAQAAEIIMRAASGLFGWDAGYIHLYSQAEDKIIPVLTMDTVNGQLAEVPESSFSWDPSPFMRSVMHYGGRLINRPSHPEVAQTLIPFGDTQRPSASMMYVPIHSRGTVLGILSIQSYTPFAYSSRDLLLLQALADQCGGAFQRIEVTEALRESEEKFRTLFESAPIGVALHSASGRYVYTNPAYQRMVGYSDDELRGLGVRRITHPDDIVEGQKMFADLHSGQRNQYHREKRYLHRSGRLVWAQSSASAIRGNDGKLLYVISMVEDISERKQVIEALRESERNLRLIAENTSDVIFAFDMQRRPVYINPAVSELTGYTFAEIQEKKFVNWIHPDDEARMLGHWDELFTGKGYSEVEFRLVTKSGEIKWCSSTWGPLLDEDGRQIGVQGRERDITERKELEREVLESTANERRRLGHELHDGLGQYLAGIAFRAKALEQTLSSSSDSKAADAKELVGLLSEAISQTRSLARGLDPVDVESIGLPAALQNLAAETRKFFNIECLLRCPDSSLKIDSHTSLPLYRIVQEAIHNGITHGEATRIEIELTGDGESFALGIRDNGRGFDVETVKRNGMGLRVMDYRARSIGAVLRIHSQVKKGTEIRCLIPVPKGCVATGTRVPEPDSPVDPARVE